MKTSISLPRFIQVSLLLLVFLSPILVFTERTTSETPQNVAQIAAFHSKAKTSKLAPVSYTFGKYVRKKKGMEPGKVLLMKENVLLVRPEIPKNAVLFTDE